MHDIIATSNNLGFSDIFLTMACNPYWTEVRESLEPIQSAKDRPELCNRAFGMKRCFLLDYIIREKVFGRVVAHVCVNEFQKRGLVHSQIILILYDPSKSSVRNPDRIDELISAENLSEEDAVLRDQVLKNMIHIPCIGNPDAVCKRAHGNGSCSKSFPKRFRPETGSTNSDHCIDHRRRSPKSRRQSGLLTSTTRMLKLIPNGLSRTALSFFERFSAV